MSIKKIHYETFKKGSKTYFNSSIFFPSEVREDVFILYGFVRVADNFVDQIPQDKEGFLDFKKRYERAARGEAVGDEIIDTFVELKNRKGFDDEWVTAFLKSMEMDLNKKRYETIDETLEYIYGSAEVIGLFMSRILGLPEESFQNASMMGRSMQYINFIRDIDEDVKLGRMYLPMSETSLVSLDKATTIKAKDEFETFITRQLDRYRVWQQKAEEGYGYIPKRYLVPIKTASDMYNYTAMKIARNPFIVYQGKVKPSRLRIFFTIFKNLFYRK